MISAILIFVVLLFIFDFYQRFYLPKNRTKTWPELAALTGLSYKPPTGPWSNRSQPHVTGMYRGHYLKLDLVKVAHGVVDDGIALYQTRIVLSMKSKLYSSLSLERRWWFWSAGNQIDDEDFKEFGRYFVIENQPKDFAVRVLASPELRQRLMKAKVLKLKLSDLGLSFEKSGVESNIDSLRMLFDLVCDLANTAEQVTKAK